MKKFILLLVATLFAFTSTNTAFAGPKMDKRHAYTLRMLKLDKKTEAAFSPILMQYLKEKKAAEKKYDDLKDKYRSAENAGTLTDKQAAQLLEAKWECAAKELEVKKKYNTIFLKMLPAKKVYYAFDYSNDKMSKIDASK